MPDPHLSAWHAAPLDRQGPPEGIVIVGQGPRQWADYGTDEVWVVNGPDFPPRWDILWQLHGWEHITRRHGTENRFFVELADIRPGVGSGRRLFMPPAAVDSNAGALYAPGAEWYPIDQLCEHAGSYFTGSIPIMIAHAVAIGAKTLRLDGMRFIPNTDDWWQAGEGWMVPCTEYHLGRAAAAGIKITVNHGSGLFRGSEWVYGFDGPGSI